MKKPGAYVIIAVLLFLLPISAFAQAGEETKLHLISSKRANPQSCKTYITYTIEEAEFFSPTFTLSIPADIYLNDEFSLTLCDVTLLSGQRLNVTLYDVLIKEHEAALHGAENQNASLYFVMKCRDASLPSLDWSKASPKKIGDVLLSVDGPCESAASASILRFEPVKRDEYRTGIYAGHLIFAVGVV